MVYRSPPPPPSNNKKSIMEKSLLSLKTTVIDNNIHKVMGRYEASMRDIILTCDFNFATATTVYSKEVIEGRDKTVKP